MVLNAQSLLILTWDENKTTQIREYSLVDLNNPININTYELYDYSIYFNPKTSKPVFAVSNNTGILTILGTKKGDSKNIYVLVYKNNYPNIQALDRAIQIGTDLLSGIENFPLDITVSGEDTYDIAYLTIKNESVALSLPKDPTLIIDLENAMTLNTYSLSVDVSFKVTSMDNSSKLFN